VRSQQSGPAGPSGGRAGWLLSGLAVLAAGLGWLVWVGYGAPADWTGSAALIRYTKPVAYASLVVAAVCFARGLRRRPPAPGERGS
jgi:hypothetical protein